MFVDILLCFNYFILYQISLLVKYIKLYFQDEIK